MQAREKENRIGMYHTPDCDWIEQEVRRLAPAIHEVQCDVDHDTGELVLWLGLLPESRLKQVRFTKKEYRSGAWKKRAKTALEEANV